MKFTRLETTRCMVGEGPVWDEAEQALYFIDIVGKIVHRYDFVSQKTRSWDVPGIIGSMALREQGGAIISLADGIHALDFETGETTPIAIAEDRHPRAQFNDGKVDRRGRFLVGSTDSSLTDTQPLGNVYRLDRDHSLTTLDKGIHISNGPCWSPDNKVLYFSDSLIHAIYAYDYDIETGEVVGRRLFAETKDLGGIPDGATVDADGLMWIAICEGRKIVAYRPDGKIERIVETPMDLPSSVMFGGPNLDLMFVTSIDPTLLKRAPEENGGHSFVIEGLGARGIAEPRYAG